MAIEITMPQLSDTMDQGTILTWHKKEGDSISRGDALAEVATDKADLEIESFHEGVLLKIHSPAGTTVKVGSVIAVLGDAQDRATTSAGSQATQTPVPQATPVQSAQETVVSQPAVTQTVQPSVAAATQVSSTSEAQDTNHSDRVKISPLAKNLAQAYGVDHSALSGTGDGGRIVKKDVEKVLGRNIDAEEVEQALSHSGSAPMQTPTQQAKAPQQPQATPLASGTRSAIPLSKMRAAIAAQMVKSTTTIPHFYVTAKLEVDALLKMRESLKSLPQYEGITVNHLMIKAAGLALRKIPKINASYQDGAMIQPEDVNIGIVTALPEGLLIPVVKNVDSLPLSELVQDAKNLVQRARTSRPKPDDLVGGTFSISNIGKLEVESFTAIISPGQGAILAVGSIQDEVVIKSGAMLPAKVLRICLSVDHRIIDGVAGGEFVTELKQLIEDPVLLLA